MAQCEIIDEVFHDDIELATRVHCAMEARPTDALLYIEIAKYIRRVQTSASELGHIDKITEPSLKKRKVENGAVANNEERLSELETRMVFEARDLSFSIPVRKKLNLEIFQSVSPALRSPPYQIRARNATSGEVEYEAGLQSFKHAFRLPVPEKIQKQHNFVLLPQSGLGAGDKASVPSVDSQEPLVWTTNDGSHKAFSFADKIIERDMQSRGGEMLEEVLKRILEGTPAGRLIKPDDTEFSSAVSEAHRKGEKTYHVKAFRGSKEGYLFFLATGIFFGFKKPLAFMSLHDIYSISYTSILQRTFNLAIAVQLPGQEEMNEHEFSMLDQADFAGIDDYVKRHQLQDSSLAESRKAKKLTLHVVGKEAAVHEADEAGQSSELQKAQAELEELEDEEEEDYEPESEDSSGGSEESSEQGELEDEDPTDDEGDLVATELGSEAEDLKPDSGDEGQL